MIVRFLRKSLDYKFKEIDNFITKKVITKVVGYKQEISERLDGIERSALDTKDTLKKENNLKFSKLKEDMSNKRKDTEDTMQEQVKKFEEDLKEIKDKLNHI